MEEIYANLPLHVKEEAKRMEEEDEDEDDGGEQEKGKEKEKAREKEEKEEEEEKEKEKEKEEKKQVKLIFLLALPESCCRAYLSPRVHPRGILHRYILPIDGL